jgi:hypothetical protein
VAVVTAIMPIAMMMAVIPIAMMAVIPIAMMAVIPITWIVPVSVV